MTVELCDLCEKKEANKKFKVKMSCKSKYGYADFWKPYKDIVICEDCAEKLFGIKTDKTRLRELIVKKEV